MFCKKCGRELEEGQIFCPDCGTKIERKAAEPEQETIAEPKQGAELGPGAELEPGAGTKSGPATEPESAEAKEKGQNKKKWFLIAGIIIAVLVIAAGVFLGLNRGKDDKATKPSRQEPEKKEAVAKKEEPKESEFIFPNSDKEYLTDADVEKLTEEELGFARNEIIARHGRIYTNEKYKAYFESKSWYKGTIEPEVFDANYENELNEIEKANVELIKKYEEKFSVNAAAEQYYASVLKEYQEAEAGGFSGSTDQYPHVNPLLFGNGCPAPLYFTLADLCGDGVPELFIGYFLGGDSSNYVLMELYGHDGAGAKQLEVGMGFGVTPLGKQNYIGERVRYYICENGYIRENGSGGAGINGVTYYELQDGKAEMSVKEGATQEMDQYYEVDEGGLGLSNATKEFYEGMQNKYSLRSDLQWHKLQDFKSAGQEKSAFHAEEAYAEVLRQYRDQKGMLMTGGDDDFTQTYPYVSWNAFDDYGELRSGLSYTCMDIDHNGVDELFIADVPEGSPEQYTVYDIYTYVNGKPERLFDASDMGTGSYYFICENDVIGQSTREEGTTWDGSLFYRPVDGSAAPAFVDGVWCYSGSSMGPVYARGADGFEGSSEDIDQEMYNAILNKYLKKQGIAWTKL